VNVLLGQVMRVTAAEQSNQREARDRSENQNIRPNARVPTRHRPGAARRVARVNVPRPGPAGLIPLYIPLTAQYSVRVQRLALFNLDNALLDSPQ
jgi:hypothetical protein